ncbi:DUF6164 family protein [Natronospira bacteriovora]|uniref:DUF6164 family protein n=1 Tax=Natronospira bacteriovora TaxID=3069753 RepID=A0ABU0W4P9_9GAMM|nr:DUF6164 family protein [Natronospira sp. AB-CW4]MDQ2068942.1 DUF6164 family protein [Natronospira sp. AB-CW4]
MSKLLLNLRHVPDDEAEDVRAMLEKADIPFYETPPNRWGITVGGIWLRDRSDYPRARSLMDEYQRERLLRVRAEREQRRREGREETLWQRVCRQPVRVVASLAAVAFIVFLMMLPFLWIEWAGSS